MILNSNCEDERVKETILEVLSRMDEPVTISDLKTLSDDLGCLETSKISQLLRQLYKPDLCKGIPKVQREEKRKAFLMAFFSTNN